MWSYTLLLHKPKNTQFFHTIIVHQCLNVTACIHNSFLFHTQAWTLLGHSVNVSIIYSALWEAISSVYQVASQVIHVLNWLSIHMILPLLPHNQFLTRLRSELTWGHKFRPTKLRASHWSSSTVWRARYTGHCLAGRHEWQHLLHQHNIAKNMQR